MDDPAAIHDVDVVGKLAAEIEILLDEEDGDAGGIAQVADGAADILDDRGLDAFGGLVQDEELRPNYIRDIAEIKW